MFTKPLVCPNPECRTTGDESFIKHGYFRTGHNRQHNPRYLCLKCNMAFSSHSDRANKGQKRPDVNAEVFKWVCSGLSCNRIAKNLGIHKRTVARKITWLAKQAEKAHLAAIEQGLLSTTYVQLDEMETFEHTRLKPLSIAVATCPKTGQIIGLQVATMNVKGHLAATARRKYGRREDARTEACLKVIEQIAMVSSPSVTVACDGGANYPTFVRSLIPGARMKVYPAAKGDEDGLVKKLDPLFYVKNLIANMRADLAPLARKTWITTQDPGRLQELLWVYIAWVNGYDICANTNRVELHEKGLPTRMAAKKRKVKCKDIFGSTVAVPSWVPFECEDESVDGFGDQDSASDDPGESDTGN